MILPEDFVEVCTQKNETDNDSISPRAVSSGLLCNHDEILPCEALPHRTAEGEGRGARSENRSSLSAVRPPNGTCFETALHEGWLETALGIRSDLA